MFGESILRIIERIHGSSCRLVISVTGGGTEAISALVNVAGASRTILAADVPYSWAALMQRLGGAVDNACSESTCRSLAMAAFEQASRLADDNSRMLRGIGATASLKSNRPKRGPHRIHVAWQSATCTTVYSCELVKGRRSRDQEQQLAAEMILAATAESCGVNPPDIPTAPDEPVAKRQKHAPQAWQELLLERRRTVSLTRDGAVNDAQAPPPVLFPGAFCPWHEGHMRMAETAEQRLRAPVTLELSIENVDKPLLDFIEIGDRLQQLADRPIWLTRAPTFTEKASLAPGCTFVVGVDTITRIADARYYRESTAQRDAALGMLIHLNCRFLVFGRKVKDAFLTLDDVTIPAPLRSICDGVREAEFRKDVSSTELRSGLV